MQHSCRMFQWGTLCLLYTVCSPNLQNKTRLKFVNGNPWRACTHMQFLSNTMQNDILDHQSQEWSLSVQRCPSVGVHVPISYSLQSEARSYCWTRTTDPVSQHFPGSLTEAKSDRSRKLSRCFMVPVDWGWGNWCSSGPKFTLCRFQNQILPRSELNGNAAVARGFW